MSYQIKCYEYDIKSKKGDTFNRRDFEITEYDDAIDPIVETPVDLTGATMIMQIRADSGEAILHTFSTANGKIVIDDAPAGKFHIEAEVLNFTAGVYKHDLQITFADGRVKTYYSGIFELTSDISE